MRNLDLLRHCALTCRLIIALGTGALLADAAQSDDGPALQTAFQHMIIRFPDDANSPWRIVSADGEMAALSTSTFLVEGTTDKKGEVRLSKKQRADLCTAWQRSPQQLWLIYYSRTLQFTLQEDHGENRIVLIEPESKITKELNAVAAKEAADRQLPLNHAFYTQAGFDAKAFKQAYADWRERFQQDLADCKKIIRDDFDQGQILLADESGEELGKVFARSIHAGKKGLGFRRELIGAFYSRDRRVLAPGASATQLLLSDSTAPVGYGGTFLDDGTTVELWYMVFDDLSDWTAYDLNHSIHFSAFAPAELPANKILERNRWPALVFVREPDGKIKLYGMSMELARILQAIFNAQIG